MNRKLPSSAGGWGAILYSLKTSRRSGGLWPLLRALYTRNSCKSCALGMGGLKGALRDESGHFPAICNKSFIAQASDMQGAVKEEFFQKHDIPTLAALDPRELELSGRLSQPLICEPGSSHYRPLEWDEAMDRIATRLKKTTPERSFFYASGRSSNEAAFLLQLFARMYGTNNVNNCSYYCHQASGVGLSQTLGTGTATVELADLNASDLIFLVGANPSSNHPRFMRILMETRRRGGNVVVVNPAKERGLEKFSVPSDWRSLLLGSEIASLYLQPHIGGDIPLFKGISKALVEMDRAGRSVLDRQFIEKHTDDFDLFQQDLDQTSWETLETSSGITRKDMEKTARIYAEARNVVFAWAMGVTHHAHGVGNVHSLVNLALLRGMVGKKQAGLLPLRGHSNVQGIGSTGFTPQLKQAVFDNLQSRLEITLPTQPGLDTLSCMEAAREGKFDFAWNLGGNLYGSNPDSRFAEEAMSNIDFVLYMNTTLNQSHFKGRGRTTIILPVLARDEEPEPTTQESMFSYVRLSEGGKPLHQGPRSEVRIVAGIAGRVIPESPLQWEELQHTGNIRQLIGSVVPGFEKIKDIDRTRKEFHIGGRIFHTPEFPTPTGRAGFKVCPLPYPEAPSNSSKNFRLMTIRSEGQFNTVVYDLDDRYRGVTHRDVVFMNPADMARCGLQNNDQVKVTSQTGTLGHQRVVGFPVKDGNIMMYYPESNVLVPRKFDEYSKTPSFKSVDVIVEPQD